MGTSQQPLSPDSEQPGHHVGDLSRNEVSWRVYLETRTHPDAGGVRPHHVTGRLHFVSGDRHRVTAWIFVEWTEQDLFNRFREFGQIELWRLLESLEGGRP